MKIFSLCNGTKVDSRVLDKPFVYGISIRPGWKALEPLKNMFHWYKVDAPIMAAMSEGKKVFFRVMVGPSSPKYIFDDPSIPKVKFYSQKTGTTVTTPVPWNTRCLKRYDFFCKNLAIYLNKLPGVEIVAVSGAADGAANPFLEEDGMAEYVKIGYTPQLWTDTWKTMIDKHLLYFPSETMSLCFDCKDNQVSQDLVAYTFEKYKNGKRITIQSNGLNGRPGFSKRMDWLKEYVGKMPIGFQMSWSSGDRLGPMDQAIENGLTFGAEYLEIYQEDILNPQYETLFMKTTE